LFFKANKNPRSLRFFDFENFEKTQYPKKVIIYNKIKEGPPTKDQKQNTYTHTHKAMVTLGPPRLVREVSR
jgi:hypothetical protein